MTAFDPETKRRFLADVENWLDSLEDSVFSDESWAREDPRLFDLFSQLTALTREVKLASGATGKLHSEITGVLAKLNPAPAALAKARKEGLQEGRQGFQKARQEGQEQGRQETVLELLEVRDNLVRGVAEAGKRLARRPSFLEKLARSRPALEALAAENRLVLERLDERLKKLGIQEIPAAAGQQFDPASMKCVETEAHSLQREGTILDVLRPGFLFQGKVLRQAEVKVSRKG